MSAKFTDKTKNPLLRSVLNSLADDDLCEAGVEFSLEVAISGLEPEKRFKEYVVQVAKDSLVLIRAKTVSQLPHHAVVVPLSAVSCEMLQRADHCIKIRPAEGNSCALRSLTNPMANVSFQGELIIRTLDTCRGLGDDTDRLFNLFTALVEAQGTRSRSVDASYYIKPKEAEELLKEVLENNQKNVPGKAEEKIKRAHLLKQVEELVSKEFRYLDGYVEYHVKLLQIWGIIATRDRSESKAFADDFRTLVSLSRHTLMTALSLRSELAQCIWNLHQLMRDDSISQLLEAIAQCALVMNTYEMAFVTECHKRQKLFTVIRQTSPLLADAMDLLDRHGSPDRRFDDLLVLAMQRLTRRSLCMENINESAKEVAIFTEEQRSRVVRLTHGLNKLVQSINNRMHEEERDLERIAKELKGAVNVVDPNRVCFFRTQATFNAPERLGGTVSSVTVFIFNDCVVLAKAADTKVGGLVLSQVYDLRPGSKTCMWSDQRTTSEGALVVKISDEWIDEVKFLPAESDSVREAIERAKSAPAGTKSMIQREIRRSASMVVRAVASPVRLIRAASVGRSNNAAASGSTPARPVQQAPPTAALARAAQIANTPMKPGAAPTLARADSQNSQPNIAHVPSREAPHPKLGQASAPLRRGAVSTPPRLAMPGRSMSATPITRVSVAPPQQ